MRRVVVGSAAGGCGDQHAVADQLLNPLLAIEVDADMRGLPGLSWQFVVSAPADAGRAGGIAPILLATVWILAIAIGVALPLGLATAVWLSEFDYRQPRLQGHINHALDVLAGVPSIVFGLFGNAFFAATLGMGLSILSGGLTPANVADALALTGSKALAVYFEQVVRLVGGEPKTCANWMPSCETMKLRFFRWASLLPTSVLNTSQAKSRARATAGLRQALARAARLSRLP